MQKNIHIFMRLPSGQRSVVGRLLHERQADGTILSYFRYEPEWLAHAASFPLDPVNLPLEGRIFRRRSRTGLWGVMEDALPDAWGRRLLQARHSIDVSRSNNIELLLLTGWAEPGATGFAESATMPGRTVVPMDLDRMEQAILASETFEKDANTISLPDFFISGGSSAGGARPKVLARSGTALYLVKFPSINDPTPDIMANLEAFGLACAREAGIPVPEFFIVRAASGRVALAVRRFDTRGGQDRIHFLSLQSLLDSEEQLGLPYARMAEIVRQVSADPERDIHALFKQMVVNIIICNRDDHLKNFSMLLDPATRGFRLTPAYDLVPNLWQRQHVLPVAGKISDIGRDDLVQEGRRFALSGQRTRQLIDEAATGVATALAKDRHRLARLAADHVPCRRLLEQVRENLAAIAPRGTTP